VREHRRPDQDLPDHRAGGSGAGSERGSVHRHVAPSQDRNAIGDQHRLNHCDGSDEGVRSSREEERADTERQSGLKVKSEAVGVAVKEASRNLRQQSGTVAGQVGRSRPSVGNSCGSLDRHGDHFMCARSIRGGHEAHAARVVLAGCVERC
jgi:hypothetical protein